MCNPNRLEETVDILSRLKDSCNTINIVQEIETSQAELAQEFANGFFPLPFGSKGRIILGIPSIMVGQLILQSNVFFSLN